MERRDFVFNTAAAMGVVPFAMMLTQSEPAQAQIADTCGWMDLPGFPAGSFQFKPLWAADAPGQAAGKLYKLQSGVMIPRHRHPEGEYNFVIDGSFTVPDGLTINDSPALVTAAKKGDYTYMPAGSVHEAATSNGVTLFTFTPANIVFF